VFFDHTWLVVMGGCLSDLSADWPEPQVVSECILLCVSFAIAQDTGMRRQMGDVFWFLVHGINTLVPRGSLSG